MKASSWWIVAVGLVFTLLVGCGAAASPTTAPAAAPTVAPTTGAAATSAPRPTTAAAATTAPAPAATGPVRLTDGKVVLGVINDQSLIYAELSGKNSTKAVQMAVDDFKAKYGANALGGPIELIDADHQNKPDLASTKAQEFYDRNQVDLILDVPTSSAALAIANVAGQKRRMYINVGAATTELTGAQCNKYTFHYAYDTYMLANGTATYVTKNTAKRWYIVYPNYAFGQDMDRSFQDAIKRNGGTIAASDASPFPSTDFSSFLLKAPTLSPRPEVLGLMHAGGELVTAVKQYNEFRLRDQKIPLAIGLMFDTDIKAIGPDLLAGTTYTTAWQWTLDAEARAWADRFKAATGVRPTFAHAGNYSAAMQYLEAIRRAGTDDADAVSAALEGYQFSDFFIRNGRIRPEDHRVIHDVYLAQVKPQSEVTEDFDFTKILSTIPAAEAFRPLEQNTCKMAR